MERRKEEREIRNEGNKEGWKRRNEGRKEGRKEGWKEGNVGLPSKTIVCEAHIFILIIINCLMIQVSVHSRRF
jgi:hypothetical protein